MSEWVTAKTLKLSWPWSVLRHTVCWLSVHRLCLCDGSENLPMFSRQHLNWMKSISPFFLLAGGMKARLLWWQFDHSWMETAKAINWSAQSTSSGWKLAVQLTWFPVVMSTMLKLTASSFPPERHEAASECVVQEVDGHGLNSTFSRIHIMPGQNPPSHGCQERQRQYVCPASDEERWGWGGVRRWSECLWSSRRWLPKKGGRMREE